MIKENKAQATGKGGSLADRLDELTGDTAQAASSDKSKSGNDPAPNPKTPPPLPTSTPAAESAQKSKPPKPPVRPASSPPSSPPKNAGNAKGNKAQSARPPKPPTPPGKQGSPAQSKPIDALKAAAAPKSPSASQPASPPKPPSKTSGKASVPPPIPGKSRSTPGPRPDPIKKSGLDVDSASVPDAIRPKDRPAPDQPGTAAPETRRPARRRPAGPSRERIAANDDAPSIGGLIYALNQKPSNKPFVYASAGSGIWAALAAGFAYGFILRDVSFEGGLAGLVSHPSFLTAFATLVGPIVLFWFLAFLSWRIEELHLRSTAMTEVAVRLAEPDRMAEQSVASLGQAVRRQVSFMNDAVSRALGRAGELEALVHNEVSTLEQSYEENERKIRGLIQ
ncbi:MAG: hypothetical protein ACR2PA_09095, partial [Hyphomicrobiaceae bacterium]